MVTIFRLPHLQKYLSLNTIKYFIHSISTKKISNDWNWISYSICIVNGLPLGWGGALWEINPWSVFPQGNFCHDFSIILNPKCWVTLPWITLSYKEGSVEAKPSKPFKTYEESLKDCGKFPSNQRSKNVSSHFSHLTIFLLYMVQQLPSTAKITIA